MLVAVVSQFTWDVTPFCADMLCEAEQAVPLSYAVFLF